MAREKDGENGEEVGRHSQKLGLGHGVMWIQSRNYRRQKEREAVNWCDDAEKCYA